MIKKLLYAVVLLPIFLIVVVVIASAIGGISRKHRFDDAKTLTHITEVEFPEFKVIEYEKGRTGFHGDYSASGEGRCVVFNTALLAPKTSRTTQGVQVMNLKKHKVEKAVFLQETHIQNLSRYRVRSIPAAGAKLTDQDRGEEQMSLLEGEF